MKKRMGIYLVLMFIVTIGIVGLFEIFWLAHFGNKPEIYTDIVLEELGAEFANKSSEIKLFWLGLLLGLLLIAILLWVRQKLFGNLCDIKEIKQESFMMIGIVALLSGEFLFYGYVNNLLVVVFILTVIGAYYFKKTASDIVAMFLIVIYSLCGIYRLYIYIRGGAKYKFNNNFSCGIFNFCYCTWIKSKSC